MGIALGVGVLLGAQAGIAGRIIPLAFVALLLAAAAVPLRRPARELALVATAGCLVGALVGSRAADDPLPPLDDALPRPIIGTVASDARIASTGASVNLSWTDDNGRARQSLLLAPAAPALVRGQTIAAYGVAETPGGTIITASATRLVSDAGRIDRLRERVRRHLTDVVLEHVPGPAGSLTLGLLIGDDSGLPEHNRDALRAAGLSHITAVSGWNVTLVTSAVGALALALGLRGWFWSIVQLVGAFAFVWLVGADPPVTRAAIMSVAGIAAIRIGRPAHSATALILTAAAMVAISPATLTSLSFRLSVTATIGLVVAVSLASRWQGWQAIVLTPAIVTAFAGLATAPLLAAEFGTASPSAIPSNLLAAPLVPMTTIAGALLVVSDPFGPLASLTGALVWTAGTAVLTVASIFASAPFGHVRFAPLSGETMLVLYLLLAVLVAMGLPEGRAVSRATAVWSRRDPAPALVVALAVTAALAVAAIAL